MRGKTIVAVGAGNIGSHLLPHLARMENVARIVVIDREAYEARNAANQDILPTDSGAPKAAVQARRLRAIRTDLAVDAVHAPLEAVPLGLWRADLIVACVDSRGARLGVHKRAGHLGVPWIDTGVLAEQWLARVNVYVPGDDKPCLECAWADADYRMLEQRYPCDGSEEAAPLPTGAPSALGALAAAMAALECRKMLNGNREHAAAGRQVVFDALGHHAVVTRFARNAACRFDHIRWTVDSLAWDLREKRLADLVALGGGAALVPEQRFVQRRICPKCGASRRLFHLEAGLPVTFAHCPGCRVPTLTPGFDIVETLTASMPPAVLGLTLAEAGLRPGDIVRAGRHFEIGASGVIGGEK